jgi:hypothetical protein
MPLWRVAVFLQDREYGELVRRAEEGGKSLSMAAVEILTGQAVPIQKEEVGGQWARHRQAKGRRNS